MARFRQSARRGLRPPRRGGRPYAQRRAADTALYELVAAHLETFLASAREEHERSLPRYVEEEFRAYLRCGIHAYGFLRARCRGCARELLVAFSCKRRGVCPSCNARRMCGTAAHLTDRVFPDVPVRQWVLSVPFELRLLLAKNHRALSAVGRIFVCEVLRAQRQRATALNIANSRGAAICFPQRFGGSLNLNVHYHVAIADGVFTLDPGAPRAVFHALPAPDVTDIATIAANVELRVVAWLRRRGLLTAERDDDNDAAPRSALDACLSGSLGLGELVALRRREQLEDSDAPAPIQRERRSGRSRGFDINAGVRVAARDRDGRERLLRYCARAPLSLERLSLLPDGRVAYALRKPWGKQTHRVMQPLELLARLAALVPPPRQPLIRFHGVLAPHSSWRASVVPADTEPSATRSCSRERKEPRVPKRRAHSSKNAALSPAPDPAFEPSSRIPWAELLKRVHDVNALACPCGGRLRFIALIQDADVAQAILETLDLASGPPPIARARSPDFRYD